AISFSDEAKGSTLRIEQLNLRTGHLANAATGDLELSANVVENKPAVKAGVALKGKYRYDLAQQQYALEGLSLRLKGDALDFKDLDAELSAKNLVAGQEIRIEGLALGVKSQLKGEALDLRLDAPQLAIAGDKAGGASVTLNLKLAGAQRQLESKLELSGVEGSKTALRIAKLAAQWDLKQAALALRGNLSSPLTANLANLAIDLPKLAGELEVEHPAMPMKHLKLPLNASLHADMEKSSAAGDLATRFDESAIQLKWQVGRFAPLAVGFDLAVDKLNVDKYFPPAPPTAAPAAGSGGGGGTVVAEAPLNLDFLKGLDLKGEARIGFLQAHNIKLGNLKADLRIADGRLDVSPLSANFYEGQINGALSVNANGNRIALRQALSNVSVNPLLRDVAQKDMLEGRGNINLDVTTAGASVGAMKQGLAGTASFNLKDGAVKGINLAKSLRELKAKLSGKQDAAVEASKTEKTDFSELAASFRIAAGVAHNDDLSLKSPFVRVGGAGDIDIGKSRIDYLAKASVVGSAKGQGDLDALKGLTIPVRLSGPFDALTYKFEFGAIATDLLKQEAKKQLEQQLGKPLDKKGLGDALKGLLK
ncbi:MAG TPA: AsmA family protein, partial [Rhodocyclaceae bacterium]